MSQVVALWMIVTALMDPVVRHTDCAPIQCVMADKDMIERDFLKEKLPQATDQICLFHVTEENMGVT